MKGGNGILGKGLHDQSRTREWVLLWGLCVKRQGVEWQEVSTEGGAGLGRSMRRQAVLGSHTQQLAGWGGGRGKVLKFN